MDSPALPGPLVDTAWLTAHLGQPGLVVLDATVRLPAAVRGGEPTAPVGTGRDDFAAGHVPGARFADLEGDLADHTAGFHYALPGPAAARTALGRLGVTPDRTVVVYDDADRMWSTRLWWTLVELGFPAVAVLDGGWAAWRRAGGAVQTGPADPVPTEAPGPDTVRGRSRTVDRSRVAEATRTGDAALVCALGQAVFEGAAPTRYARPGHIPGSHNLPAKDRLLTADGTFRAPDELARELSGLPDDRELLLYCGGGISATLLAFALHLVHRDDVLLYDGSLEEWAADPAAPLRTGPADPTVGGPP